MTFVPAICPQCGAGLNVDPSKDAAICKFCGNAFIVEKAIFNYSVSNTVNIRSAGNTINVIGNVSCENYLKLARRARALNDSAEAGKYYTLALEADPDNWEANLYGAYYKYHECNPADTELSVSCFIKSIERVLLMLPSKMIDYCADQICALSLDFGRELFGKVIKELTSTEPNNSIGYDRYEDYRDDLRDSLDHACRIFYETGNDIERLLQNDTVTAHCSLPMWKEYIICVQTILNEYLAHYGYKAKKYFLSELDLYEGKIRRFEPGYTRPGKRKRFLWRKRRIRTP